MKKQFKNKKILILGGIGFIGSNLASRLQQMDANVTLVDSMLPSYGGNMANIDGIASKVKINFSDIRDTHSMNFLVKDVDIIYSLAGQTSHIDSMSDPMTDLEINCVSQLSILESCRKYNPQAIIIYASTRQLYGKPQYLPVDEKHPEVPVDVNGINKLAAEKYYSLYAKVYKMKCVSLRLTNTYGPRQQLRGNSHGFAGIFIRKALKGEKIQIFGDGKQIRDFNYIDDVVDAFLLAAVVPETNGRIFNLGARPYYSLLDFVAIIAELCLFDFEIVPFPKEHKAVDIGDFYSDFSLFHATTGWEPKVSLKEGLKKTIEYFKPNLSRYL